MVAIVEVEGGEPGGGMDSVIVSELNGGEVGIPVVLEGVDVVAETGEDDLVGVLRLAVGLGVVGSGHVEGGVGEGGEGGPEGGGEAWVPIRDKVGWPTMETEDVVEEYLGDPFTGDGLGGGNDVDELGEAISEGDEGVMAAGGEGEAGDQIEGDGLPRLVWDGEGLEEAMGVVRGTNLACLAGGAIGKVSAHGVVEAGPVEMTAEAGDGLGDPEVASNGDVMGFLE